jgi:hypothetical protein
MGPLKEFTLNGLLAALVLSSVVLSAQIWFPSDQVRFLGAREALVQPPPPRAEGRMPNLFRPERVYFRQGDGKAAMVQSGAPEYEQIWLRVNLVLTGIRSSLGPFQVEEFEAEPQRSITLALPLALTLGEWADHWNWAILGMRNTHIKIDRVIFIMGQNAGMYLSGPAGDIYRMGSIAPVDHSILQDVFDQLKAGQFQTLQALEQTTALPGIAKGLLVPSNREVPAALVEIHPPDEQIEASRYFPDLSVVRQIDERDARSFTDGQRLMRITSNGVLEYRTANPMGMTPDLSHSLLATQEWVANRGGWEQSLILSGYSQQPGLTQLVFDVRAEGPFPIESHSVAMQVQVTTDRGDSAAERIASLQRMPDFTVHFGKHMQPIISAESALEIAMEKYPREVLLGVVREMYIAYVLKSEGRPGALRWTLEPSWVLQIGEERIVIPALSPNNEASTSFHP